MTMPDQMWFSIGFGNSIMTNTDMIGWHAAGDEDSKVVDYYSPWRNTPTIDPIQDLVVYKRAIPSNTDPDVEGAEYNQVQFLVYRDLDTGDTADDYVIKLGEEMEMIWGIRVTDSRWYGHDFRGTWDLMIDETTGNEVPKPVPSEAPQLKEGETFDTGVGGQVTSEGGEVVSCFSNTWDVFNLKTCFDKDNEEIVFTAFVPDNTWLGIGFGNTMKDVDMILWRNIEGEAVSRDLWSTDNGTPDEDDV